VILDVLWINGMVWKSTEQCAIELDSTQITLSVMIRAKYKHVARQIGTIVGMPEGSDVVRFSVRQPFPERDSKTADLTMVMMA
jgi:hypothetical protein